MSNDPMFERLRDGAIREQEQGIIREQEQHKQELLRQSLAREAAEIIEPELSLAIRALQRTPLPTQGNWFNVEREKIMGIKKFDPESKKIYRYTDLAKGISAVIEKQYTPAGIFSKSKAEPVGAVGWMISHSPSADALALAKEKIERESDRISFPKVKYDRSDLGDIDGLRGNQYIGTVNENAYRTENVDLIFYNSTSRHSLYVPKNGPCRVMFDRKPEQSKNFYMGPVTNYGWDVEYTTHYSRAGLYIGAIEAISKYIH